jgi:hypothetical protein
MNSLELVRTILRRTLLFPFMLIISFPIIFVVWLLGDNESVEGFFDLFWNGE